MLDAPSPLPNAHYSYAMLRKKHIGIKTQINVENDSRLAECQRINHTKGQCQQLVNLANTHTSTHIRKKINRPTLPLLPLRFADMCTHRVGSLINYVWTLRAEARKSKSRTDTKLTQLKTNQNERPPPFHTKQKNFCRLFAQLVTLFRPLVCLAISFRAFKGS